MKKYQIFSIIFATVFVATTTLLVSSCSQDDDYYESEMYTRAGTKMTRSAEPSWDDDDEEEEEEPEVPFYYLNEKTERVTICAGLDIVYTAACDMKPSPNLQPTGSAKADTINSNLVKDVTITNDHAVIGPSLTYVEVECQVQYQRYNPVINAFQQHNEHHSHTFPLKCIMGSLTNPPAQPND